MWEKIEQVIKEGLYDTLRSRTKIFLDYIDGMKEGDGITQGEIKRLETMKIRAKQMFMEMQSEILNMIKNGVETGKTVKPIDKRKVED